MEKNFKLTFQEFNMKESRECCVHESIIHFRLLPFYFVWFCCCPRIIVVGVGVQYAHIQKILILKTRDFPFTLQCSCILFVNTPAHSSRVFCMLFYLCTHHTHSRVFKLTWLYGQNKQTHVRTSHYIYVWNTFCVGSYVLR